MTESRREANKIKCRQKILKASRRLFKSKGYENTMIEDVADKAEVSKATLYNYFPNKESLLLGTAEEEVETIKRYMDTELVGIESSEERIRKMLTFLIADSIPFISVTRRILYLNSCERSPLYQKGNQIREFFTRMTRQAQEEGTFKDNIETEEIVDILMGIYLNSQFQWEGIETYDQQTCAEKVNHILDLALAGVYQ